MQSRKPNSLQIEVAELVKTAVDYWTTTNDLYSPSHYTEHSCVFQSLELDNLLTESQGEILTRALDDILGVIQQLKPTARE